MQSPGKAAGILKKKSIDEDGYLKAIKEDYRSFDGDDSQAYSMT